MNSHYRTSGSSSERGQALVEVAFLLFVLLAISALAIDLGYLYVCHSQISSAAQAAALAGGQGIPDGTAAADAKLYTGSPTDNAVYNLHPNLHNLTSTISFACLTPPVTTPPTVYPPCVTNGGTSANAIKVVEAATVDTFFAKIFGVRQIPVGARLMPSAQAGQTLPITS